MIIVMICKITVDPVRFPGKSVEETLEILQEVYVGKMKKSLELLPEVEKVEFD